MSYNRNPLTEKQENFLKALRNKLTEIKNPDKEILENRHIELYIEHTKKLGSIPKIRFKPNSCSIKEEIMLECGYAPLVKANTWQQSRNAAASYCQELCMASGGDPFFNNAINKFYSPDYFSKSLGVM